MRKPFESAEARNIQFKKEFDVLLAEKEEV